MADRPIPIHGWSAKRAGAAITIMHATGKITGVVLIWAEDGKTLAQGPSSPGVAGKVYELS